MKKSTKLLILLSLMAIVVIAAAVVWRMSPAPPAETVNLQIPYRHGPTYAGFYSAEKSGLYANAGLKVGFLPLGTRGDPIDSLVSGKAQFALAIGGSVLAARDAGKKVKALACIYRRSPLVFIARADSGIKTPADFKGKKVRGTVQNQVVLYSLIAKFGLKPGNVEHVKTRDLKRFRSGEIDVWTGYSSSSLPKIRKMGRKVVVFHPDNYGVHFYNSCIVAADAFIERNRDVVKRFLDVSLRQGWPMAFSNPNAAAAIVASFQPRESVKTHAQAISVMLPLVDTGTGRIGWMEPEVWQQMAANMKKFSLLDASIDTRDAFTMSFLREIYGVN